MGRALLGGRGALEPVLGGAHVRGLWWGHDTLEDKEQRRRKAEAKGIIAWTDPEAALDEKKELSWSPERIEEEARMALKEKGSDPITNAASFVQWARNKVLKPYLLQALIDPVWFKQETHRKGRRYLVRSQVFVKERLLALGPDLAAAHFLCHNNCRVRFKGHTEWTELAEDRTLDIPAMYVPGWFVEAIDAAEAMIVYEGLQNLRNLHHLKELDLSYCPYIDEWCMDRITGEFHHSLEVLNISGCAGVNWNGLEVLWRCSKLKVLVIKDMEHIQDLSLLCLMLLDVIPGLKIQGAEYLDLSLLEGTEHQHLLEDEGVPRVGPGVQREVQEEREAREEQVVWQQKVEEVREKEQSQSQEQPIFNIRNPVAGKAAS